MAMKKTSGGDSPLRQGSGKSFWTLPSLGRRRWWIAMCSRKLIGYLGFSRRGVFIGEGAMSEVGLGGLTPGWRSPGPGRAGRVCGAPVAPLLLLFGSLEAPKQNKTSGTCFIQFREYFLCITFETQKTAENWELALWQLIKRLVPENA
jgi:hypothetical protein